jgi:hypothetical protein
VVGNEGKPAGPRLRITSQQRFELVDRQASIADNLAQQTALDIPARVNRHNRASAGIISVSHDVVAPLIRVTSKPALLNARITSSALSEGSRSLMRQS